MLFRLHLARVQNWTAAAPAASSAAQMDDYAVE